MCDKVKSTSTPPEAMFAQERRADNSIVMIAQKGFGP
jgi:hypothetical protein